MDNIVREIDKNYIPNNRETKVYNSIFQEYERVVIESLLTSFGLDFLINDQYGGDVDTTRSVRQIGTDSNMYYKDKQNELDYNNRGEYNHNVYHSDRRFADIKANAKQEWQQTGKPLKDEYTGGDIGFYGKTNAISPEKKAELDHIIATKEIHDDRARVLSELNGLDLANQPDNFAFTNKSLNASLGDKRKSEYVEQHPTLSESTKKNMLEKERQATKAYNDRIDKTYYFSKKFISNSSIAAANVGVRMGIRQAMGLVFAEIWFAVKAEINNCRGNGETLFTKIGNGVKKGLENAKSNYKQLLDKFFSGALAGILSSLTTTICNIFFTTAKNIVKIIRESWASLTQAAKVLIINPDCLPFGERLRAAAKILSTGASVVIGTQVGELVHKTGIGAIPVLGDIVPTFCATLVSGIMSCSMLYLLDHNSLINKIVELLNKIPTVDDIVRYHRMMAALLDEYCAKLYNLDIDKFKKEVEGYCDAVSILEKATNEVELNMSLKNIYKKLGLASPYGEHSDIHSFMADKTAVLTFK